MLTKNMYKDLVVCILLFQQVGGKDPRGVFSVLRYLYVLIMDSKTS
jgi:hypothetical protein